MGQTDTNFWQIKITIKLISHINISFFYYHLCFFQYNLFLLDYNKIHKKQKFGALDVVESQSKEMWFSSYVVSVEIITQVSLTP